MFEAVWCNRLRLCRCRSPSWESVDADGEPAGAAGGEPAGAAGEEQVAADEEPVAADGEPVAAEGEPIAAEEMPLTDEENGNPSVHSAALFCPLQHITSCGLLELSTSLCKSNNVCLPSERDEVRLLGLHKLVYNGTVGGVHEALQGCMDQSSR